MRGWPANLITHINSELLTVSTCWKITRQDGTILRFCDHDQDVWLRLDVTEPSASIYEKYEANSGFTRSSIATKDNMSVDSMDVMGLLDSDAISDADLLAGRYDHAEVVIFVVDWEAPKESEIGILRVGKLGEMKIRDEVYECELRGKTQSLGVHMCDVYSAQCRVDLFSTECGLTAASWKQSAMIEAITDQRQFTCHSKLYVDKWVDFTAVKDSFEVAVDAVTGYASKDVQTPDGSAAHPYQVSNATELNAIRNDVHAHYALTANIDATSLGAWTPIPAFHGTLDGRGYKISNLDLTTAVKKHYVDTGDHGWGFIAVLGAQGTIRRLGVEDANVSVGVGSNVWMAPLAGYCCGTIEECWAEGGYVSVTNNYAGYVGGLLGRIRSSSNAPGKIEGDAIGSPAAVKRCWAAVAITGSKNPGYHSGFCGYTDYVGGYNEEYTYFDSDVATTTDKGGGDPQSTALTTAQAQQSTNYNGFDFDEDWLANDGVDYPRLLDPGRSAAGDGHLLRTYAIDLSVLNTYNGSTVTWVATEPGSSSIVVYVSRNGGVSWTACTSGNDIPGFTPSESLSGEHIVFRVVFTESGSDYPTLESLHIEVESEDDAFDSDAKGSNEWFERGQVYWTSGLNAGLAMEVKQWTASSRTVKLILKMPFDIEVGDTIDLYPGCIKRFDEDCVTKFNNGLNFRGEPHVPGTDHIMQIPDVRQS